MTVRRIRRCSARIGSCEALWSSCGVGVGLKPARTILRVAILRRLGPMRVSLFVTCLVDQLWPEVGVATVKLLRAAGCKVSFDEAQTCCGQPAFNSGYRAEAREVAQRTIELFEEAEAVVMPSGSCAAMAHHYPGLFAQDDPWRARAERLAGKTHELSTFLVRVLGREDFGAQFKGRIAWHHACHGLRDLGIREEPRRLIQRVEGAQLVATSGDESCCGFGGTFAIKYPDISVAMLDQKIQALEAADVDVVASGDVSCLTQIAGRLERRRSRIRAMHLAEILTARSDGHGSRATTTSEHKGDVTRPIHARSGGAAGGSE